MLISDEDWEKSELRKAGLNRQAAEKQMRHAEKVNEYQKTADELSHGNPIKGLFRMLTGK